jgi:ATP-dependent Clp protease adaptor protein ClpS
MSAVIELPRVDGPGTGTGGAWHVIVQNDDHNTFDSVAEALAFTLPGGLAIVWTGDQDLAEGYWGQLADAGLTMAPLERA